MGDESETKTQRSEQVEYLAQELLIPRHEADRLLANMEATA